MKRRHLEYFQIRSLIFDNLREFYNAPGTPLLDLSSDLGFMSYPGKGNWLIDGVEISSCFDSGNLKSIELNDNPLSDEDAVDRRQGRRPEVDLEFRCVVAPDMAGTEFENGNKSWFHFRVTGAHGKTVRFNMMNLNRHQKLYNQGMAPVFMVHQQGTEMPNIMLEPERWNRVCSVFSHTSDGVFLMSFWHTFTTAEDVYFSFSYPCSVEDTTKWIDKLEKKHRFPEEHSSSDIYFHREILCRSIDGRPVELLTISSAEGITDEVEPNFAHNLPPPFPERADEENNNDAEENKSGQKAFMISARVHPGETPASHVLRGMVDFILRTDDKRSATLRSRYVFKIIPILNPDGVVRGHYRTDARGQNLNRFYLNPDVSLQPQCFAYRQLIYYLHRNYRLDGKDIPNDIDSTAQDYDSLVEDKESGVGFLIDLHAHAAKRGAFLFGNRLKLADYHAETLCYARLTAANSAHMDFDACCFSQRNMNMKDKRDQLSKEGSCRVAFYYLTGSPHIYTLECNYNTGRYQNAISSRDGALTPPIPPAPLVKYTPDHYAEVGRGLLCGVLDVFTVNPIPRVAPQQVKSLRGQISRQVEIQRSNPSQRRKITSKNVSSGLSLDRLSQYEKPKRFERSLPVASGTKVVRTPPVKEVPPGRLSRPIASRTCSDRFVNPSSSNARETLRTGPSFTTRFGHR
ncbi:Oidioi.mRNA.OKI2018_I69.XSR.g14306.t2.cds [Oikopleura dioica]|uniref:Cytosolic carboxypeptidase-like protein 5 n=1 Tax=Oikopleura dioica TaxID=34765 RepID=A0ABN7S9E0_OIKDI|nr:Oidioi.mRNA.OKI2018_I69.XSR.g14306.t2.cds [Oikopleura dioica]